MATGDCFLTLSFSGKVKIRISAKGGCTCESDLDSDPEDPRILDRGGVRCIDNTDDISTEEPIQVYNGSDGSLPSVLLLENVGYMIELVEGKPDSIFDDLKENNESSLEERTLSDGRSIFNLRFRGYVGKGILDATIDKERVEIEFEVRSRKMSYLKEYPQMLSDIAEFSTALLMTFKSPLHTCYDLSDDSREAVYEEFMVLDYIFTKLDFKGIYCYVRCNPHSELEVHTEAVPAGLASDIDPADLAQLVCEDNLIKMEGGPIVGGYVPREVSERIWEDSYDTPENRLVKDLVLTMDYMASDLSSSKVASESGYVKNRLSDMSSYLNEIVGDQWLADVGVMEAIPQDSSVLRGRYGYADLFHMYLMLGLGAVFKQGDAEGLLKGQNKKIHRVYEYWCYTRLFKCLSEMAGNDTKPPIKPVDDEEWTLTIDECSQFIVPLENSSLDVRLYYNRGYSDNLRVLRSYSLEFIPDFTLVIEIPETSDDASSENASSKRAVIVNFDAKYKNKSSSEGHSDTDGDDSGSDPLEKDIHKMHTYRDALIYSCGSYVLYPGDTFLVYTKPYGKQDLDLSLTPFIPSVGAIPLKPGDEDMVEIHAVLNKVFVNIVGITEGTIHIEDPMGYTFDDQ